MEKKLLLLALIILAVFNFNCSSQKEIEKPVVKEFDWSGNWKGSVQSQSGMDLAFKLILTKNGATYSGTMEDDNGRFRMDFKDAKPVENTLSFNTLVQGAIQVDVKLTFQGDQISGVWQMGDRDSGSISMTKEVKK